MKRSEVKRGGGVLRTHSQLAVSSFALGRVLDRGDNHRVPIASRWRWISEGCGERVLGEGERERTELTDSYFWRRARNLYIWAGVNNSTREEEGGGGGRTSLYREC
jgi:hypothetical protein